MTKTVSLREENNEERRRKILGAARSLFDRQGFEATTVAQIAKASKSSLRTVYNVFPAKIDILAALLFAETEAQLKAGLARLEGTEDCDPQSRLMQFLELLARIFTSEASRHESRLVTAHAISVGRTTLAGQIYDDIDREMQGRILALLQELQARGALRDGVEPEPLMRLVFNATNGLFFLWLGNDTMTEAQCIELLKEHVAILL